MKIPAQSRNRTPSGVPTGGEFAVERKGESDLSTLAGATVGVRRSPSMLEEPLRLDPAREWGRKKSARADTDALRARSSAIEAELASLDRSDPKRTQLVVERDRIREDEAPLAAQRARATAVLHAAASPPDLERLMDESDRLQAEDPARAERYGLTTHRSRIATDVMHTRGALEEMQHRGFGEACHPVSDDHVLSVLGVGARVGRTPLHGTGSGFTSEGERIIAQETGVVWVQKDGHYPRTIDLSATRAVEDSQGNLIFMDRETFVPTMALTRE